MVPFESLAAINYWNFIVTMAISLAVSEILSVKLWRDHCSRKRMHQCKRT